MWHRYFPLFYFFKKNVGCWSQLTVWKTVLNCIHAVARPRASLQVTRCCMSPDMMWQEGQSPLWSSTWKPKTWPHVKQTMDEAHWEILTAQRRFRRTAMGEAGPGQAWEGLSGNRALHESKDQCCFRGLAKSTVETWKAGIRGNWVRGTEALCTISATFP